MSSDDVYAALLGGIVSGTFQPNERLVEADLEESLGAGRGAIRTALVRLEQERLVERERNRGARVRLVPVAEAIEILETRSVLEGLLARRAAERVTDEEAEALRSDLAELRDRLDRGDLLAA
jgi:DNA-binding GntR family transcriptional regulator